ncbi:MAG: transglutaminase family protein [Hyphomonadaceae bacterium]|nr:transglutaminase family protein [Hyphomonadaceae bacterium]
MPAFHLRHATTYAFSSPVSLGPHQLYLRPRADHRLKLNASSLTLSPPADVVWRNDLYGNSVAIARFAAPTTQLDIVSELDVETFPRSEEQRRMLQDTSSAGHDPAYSELEERLLAPFINIGTASKSSVRGWIERASAGARKSRYERLLECAARIRFEFDYRPRFEPGLQSPQDTLQLYSGTCRDFAVLMIAAARTLGCAARFVTGYVFTPNAAPGSSSPHAWAEIYIPGVGWIELDATNGLVDDGDLIPVASASSGEELTPISGAFEGMGVSSTMTVAVDVIRTDSHE